MMPEAAGHRAFAPDGEPLLLVGAAEAVDALPMDDAMALIRQTYAAQDSGFVRPSAPSLLTFPGAPFGLGAKGALLADRGVAGLRLLSKAGSRLLLWSLETGLPLALVDESLLFRFRTGMSAAVVAQLLRPGLRGGRVAIVGAGPIARRCAEGLARRLAPQEIRLASRSGTSAAALAASLAAAGIPATGAAGVAAAVRDAELVVTITTADRPVLHADMLAEGAAVLSMGGGPELAHDIWTGAADRYVDDLDYALAKGDARGWIDAGLTDAAELAAGLTGAVGGLAAGRLPPPAGRAVAIVQGFAGLDVALAHAALLRLLEADGPRRVPR